MAQANIGPSGTVAGQDTLSYLNPNEPVSVLRVKAQRNPTSTDKKYRVGTLWINESTNNIWILSSVVLNAANWEPVSQSAEGNAPITEYVISSDGRGDYTTIQAAITALGTNAGSIWVRPGSYVENLSFPAGFIGSLVGAVGNGDVGSNQSVQITGVHTPPTGGSLVCRNIRFISATHVFSSATAGTSPLILDNCHFELTNGFTFSLANWTGPLTIKHCTDSSTTNSLVTNSGGSSTINILHSEVGAGTTLALVAGVLNILHCTIGSYMQFNTNTVFRVEHTTFNGRLICLGDSTGDLFHTVHRLPTGHVIAYNSSGNSQFSNIVVDSDTTPPIQGFGSGTLSISSVDFLDQRGFSANLTIANDDVTVGNLTILGQEFIQELVFRGSPLTCTAANTGGVATGGTGDVNLLGFEEGFIMEQFIIGAGQTIIKPVVENAGLLCSLDLTATEGAEYNFGAARTTSPFAFTIGTSPDFFFEVTMTLADISGGNPYVIGFRGVAANSAVFAYADYYAMGMITGTSATNVSIRGRINNLAPTTVDSGDAWTGGDGGTTTLRVNVSGSGVVTATIDGAAPTTPLALTFDNGDVIVPFIHLLHGAAAPGAVHLVSMKVGLE